MFAGSLIENISPDNKIKEEELNEFIRINALDFSKSQKNVEDDQKSFLEIEKSEICKFKIDNNGKNLSNGEKQMINIIRVLMTNNEIICLDEANSNLDPETGCLYIFFL